MLFDLIDFIFCPIDGILRPQNLALIMPLLTDAFLYARRAWTFLFSR